MEKARDKTREEEELVKVESSLRERPERQEQRKLTDYLMLEGSSKVHSLIDKIYQPKNLEIAWQKVKSNRGSGGIDGITLEAFEMECKESLHRLHEELRCGSYHPHPVRRVEIPKRGEEGKKRPLGIPSVYDRVCQQALLQRLEPIFEELFDESSFGYRKGRRTRDALGKVWKEIEAGSEWIVDADLRDYFGTVDHEKLVTLVSQRVADSKVLRLIRQMLKAGYMERGRLFPTTRGTPQGGVVSPILSNVLLTPFDKEMRRRGYKLTRWADDWVVTCKTKAEAKQALATAVKILQALGVELNPKKTRTVHISNGFEFLGFKIGKGSGKYNLSSTKMKSKRHPQNLYARPTDKSVKRFKDTIKRNTKRRIPLTTGALVKRINPIIQGWGLYYKKAQVRRLFNQLDRWVVRRLWSHRYKKWRCAGWKTLSEPCLRGKLGLVSLISLIPSITLKYSRS
jgi:RNA-directed DNA polymerase